MTQGINKSFIFEKEEEIKYYISIMNKTKEKYNIEIIAYCIMNNHSHILLKSDKTEELSNFMHALNTQYAMYYNKRHNKVGYVFRNRYKSEGIYTNNHLYNCIRYIYNNPVKAGICSKPEEYPYSNFKENKLKLKETEKEYNFMDIEEDGESDKEIINNYVDNRNLCDILNNNEELKKMILYLKNVKKMSFRRMEKQLGYSREKLRKMIK
jgi:REP element-mobilizing transposase RayT